jgi:hypothetical protein
MAVKEASSAETPYGRYITSDGWFVLNLGDALAVRNEDKGGATYPLEPREPPFADFGVDRRTGRGVRRLARRVRAGAPPVARRRPEAVTGA